MNAFIASANHVWQDARGRTALLVFGSVAIGIVFAFWNGFADLGKRWSESEELSHSWFLPLVAGWMLWERRSALKASVGAPAWFGLLGAAGALFLLFLGELTHVLVLGHVGLVGLLLCLPLIFGGWSLFAVCFVPLAYLVFMVPPPYWVITVLSGKFQLMSSSLGVDVIRMFDIPVYLSGNVIQLPSQKLQVVEACSGLRYLFPFLSLGALAGYFYKGPLWQRIFIFLSTIPITIVMNSFRIAVTGVLVENYGNSHTEGFLHLFEGWVVFLMCIALLALVIWAFTLMRGRRKLTAFVGFEEVSPVSPTGRWSQGPFLRNGIILTALLLVSGIVVHSVGTRALIVPERSDFATLPFEFEGWRSRETTLAANVQRTLAADDYIITEMTSPEGEVSSIYIAYLDMLRGNSTWHSPSQCLPGGGWEIAQHDIVPVTRPDGREYHHNRMVIQQNDQRILVYYWYDQRGRKIADEFIMKFAVLWDSLARRRSDGAMVRLMTPIRPDENVADADARLDELRRELNERLPKYVPA